MTDVPADGHGSWPSYWHSGGRRLRQGSKQSETCNGFYLPNFKMEDSIAWRLCRLPLVSHPAPQSGAVTSISLVNQHGKTEKLTKLALLSLPRPRPTLSLEWTPRSLHSWQGSWKVRALTAPGDLTRSRGKVPEACGPWGWAAVLGQERGHVA